MASTDGVKTATEKRADCRAARVSGRKANVLRSVARVFISVAGVGALTGGFGMLVPHVTGLPECGGFWRDRLVLAACLLMAATGVAMAVGRKSGLAFGVLVTISCAFNVAVRQDPVGAVMNWHVQTVDFKSPEAARYPIDSDEYIVHDHGTYIALNESRPAAD